jgi:hypothetical protein
MGKFSLLKISVTLLACTAWLGPSAVRASEGGIVALTPRPSEHVSASPKVLTVRVTGRSALERSAVRLVVDGRDVSDAISTAGNVVQYKPPQPLASGEHAVEVAVTDTAGGRLSYSWTFTIDGAAAQTAQRSAVKSSADDAAAPDPATNTGDGGDAAAPPPAPGYGAPGSQEVYGQQNFYGGFYPMGGGPYYWGDNAQFGFAGVQGGYGFVTFAGIPGVFDLLPLGLNTFYAIVPIPIGFIFGSNPFITCHFFTPGGAPTVVVVPSFPIVRHRRVPAAEPTVHTPVVGRAPMSLPQVGTRRTNPVSTQRGMPAWRAMPNFHVVHAPGRSTRPIAFHPVMPFTPSAPHFAVMQAPHPVARLR